MRGRRPSARRTRPAGRPAKPAGGACPAGRQTPHQEEAAISVIRFEPFPDPFERLISMAASGTRLAPVLPPGSGTLRPVARRAAGEDVAADLEPGDAPDAATGYILLPGDRHGRRRLRNMRTPDPPAAGAATPASPARRHGQSPPAPLAATPPPSPQPGHSRPLRQPDDAPEHPGQHARQPGGHRQPTAGILPSRGSARPRYAAAPGACPRGIPGLARMRGHHRPSPERPRRRQRATMHDTATTGRPAALFEGPRYRINFSAAWERFRGDGL